MNVSLPSPVASYFQAANVHDTMAVVAAFTPDAVVGDEGHEYRGAAAIRDWSDKVIATYRPLAEVTGAAASPEGSLVTAQVSGTFPGSPVEIRYRFTLRDGKISALHIEA